MLGASGRAAGTRLVGDALGEERGRFAASEAEAFLRGGKRRNEVGVVFAEVLRRVEEVAVFRLVEPVPDRGPFAAIGQRNDDLQLGEGSRRHPAIDEFPFCANVARRLGVAGQGVFLSFRRVGGRLDVETLPTGLQVRKPLGVEDHTALGVERRWRIYDSTVDEFAVACVHGGVPFTWIQFHVPSDTAAPSRTGRVPFSSSCPAGRTLLQALWFCS